MRGQILFGDEDFIERFTGYLKGHKDIQEVPKIQRYIGRPSLDSIFDGRISSKDKYLRDKKIIKAVEEYGYSQKEVADYLGIHYSTISRLVNRTISKSKTRPQML